MFVLIDLRLIPVGDFRLPANEIRLEEHVFPCISARIVAFLRAPQSFESQIVLPVDERSLRKFMDEKLLIDDLIGSLNICPRFFKKDNNKIAYL